MVAESFNPSDVPEFELGTGELLIGIVFGFIMLLFLWYLEIFVFRVARWLGWM